MPLVLKSLPLVSVALLLAALPAAHADDTQAGRSASAAWSVLQQRCLNCHGSQEQEGNLRIDSRDALLRGGEQGAAIVPGKAGESLLMKAVRRATKELAMPPKEELSAKEIATLEEWINSGALWPVELPAAPGPAPGERLGDAWHDQRNPIVKIFRGERLDLWSLKPLARAPLPTAQHSPWPQTSIDHFILARLDKEHRQPNVEAERRVLCRRVTYDLTGLPPTAAELDSFINDDRPDDYERLVNRLLASPRYGEHQARWWLDVVRYSDSNGFDWDEYRPRAHLFRDYVVRSFNADKPFDQFVTEQLAGDELFEGPPQTLAQRDALLATGFLRIGPQDNSAPLFNEQTRARHEWMSDVTETTASAFLGLTLSCCRCHDHKFDPLSQADHFRLRAFFEPLQYADDLPTNLASEQATIRAHNEQIAKQLPSIEEQQRRLRDAIGERVRNTKRSQLKPAEADLLARATDQLTDEEKKQRQQLEKQIEPSNAERQAAATVEEQGQEKRLTEEVNRLKAEQRKFEYALLATDRRDHSAKTHLLYLGDYKSPREEVSAGFISILDPNPAAIQAPPNARTSGRRLTLARWITDRQNPLTARVLVNRVWQQHFGRGIVATPNDFGLAGARPTHPELLDHLASQFMDDGWSLKRLHLAIVTSAAYRQASQLTNDQKQNDPENALFARQSLRRLTAEQLRDSVLLVSGLLNSKTEGKPVWPELPADVLQANPAFLDDNAEKTKGWYPSPEEEQHCRSLFLVQKRTVRIPFLETFDLPENTTSCGRRDVSTVAPQALALLNSPMAAKAAKAFAARVERECQANGSNPVHTAYRIALQRDPSSSEAEQAHTFLAQRTLAEFCRVLLNLNEFLYIE